ASDESPRLSKGRTATTRVPLVGSEPACRRHANNSPPPMRRPAVRAIAATGIGRRDAGAVGAGRADSLTGTGVVVPTADTGGAGEGTVTAAVAPLGVPTWSVAANSFAEANRSAGTSASAFRIASSTAGGTVRRAARTLGAGSVSRLITIDCAVGPV